MLTLFLLGAGLAGTFTVTDQSDVRTRLTYSATPGSPATSASGFDLDTTPSAQMLLHDRRWSLSFGYSPSFTLTDLQLGYNPDFFQTLFAGVAWRDRRVTLTLTDSVSYGTFRSSYLFQPGAQTPEQTVNPTPGATPGSTPGGAPAPGTAAGMVTPPATLQLAPNTLQTISYLSNRSSAAVLVTPGPRVGLAFGGSYTLAGGLGSDQSLVPFERGAEADVSFGYAVSRRDHFLTSVSAQDELYIGAPCFAADGTALPVPPEVTCRPETQGITLLMGASHALDPHTTLSLSAGPQFFRTRSDTGDPWVSTLVWYPSVQSSYTHRFATTGLAALIVSVVAEATPDYRTGVVSELTEADLALLYVVNGTVSITMDAAAGQTLPPDSPVASTIARTGAEADFRLDHHGRLTLRTGLTGQWQTQNSFGNFFSTFGYFAVTAATPALRF